ncbi:UNVERIFIED_CONTAM: hypothetical protein GTU68_020984 [Idotea baltica]|nr:hypothetical protein [Idotea baltica]
MPETTGLEFLFQLREAGDEIPIIVISGRTAVDSRVEGLRLGADDYICKPVNFDEVLARIEAVLRSRNILPTLTFGDLAVDCATRKVSRAGNNIDLSPREYDFLSALLQADGDSVSRETLLREVWGLSFDPETNVIDVHVGRVRKKLDVFGPSMIETVRGEGYRLIKPEPAE